MPHRYRSSRLREAWLKGANVWRDKSLIAGIHLLYHYGLTVLGLLAATVYVIGHWLGIW